MVSSTSAMPHALFASLHLTDAALTGALLCSEYCADGVGYACPEDTVCRGFAPCVSRESPALQRSVHSAAAAAAAAAASPPTRAAG